jgi:hypothetical protein
MLNGKQAGGEPHAAVKTVNRRFEPREFPGIWRLVAAAIAWIARRQRVLGIRSSPCDRCQRKRHHENEHESLKHVCNPY